MPGRRMEGPVVATASVIGSWSSWFLKLRDPEKQVKGQEGSQAYLYSQGTEMVGPGKASEVWSCGAFGLTSIVLTAE